MQKSVVSFFFFLSIFIFQAVPLYPWGEEEEGLESLLFAEIPMITSTAYKAQELKDAPANVHIITGEEMLNRGYTTIMDLLYDLPGVTIQNQVGNDRNLSPVIRGNFFSKRLKFLLNGMDMDEKGGGGYGWDSRMPIEGIDHAEFILGPYSSLYGRNSFSGVLNIVTKSGSKINGGELDLLYGKWDRMQTTLLVGEKTEKWDLYFSAFKNYSEDGVDLTHDYPERYARKSREGRYFEDADFHVTFPAEKEWDDWNLFWEHTDLYIKIKHASGFQFDYDYNKAVWPEAGTYLTPLFYAQPVDSDNQEVYNNARLKYDYATDLWTSETSYQFQKYKREGILWYLDSRFRIYMAETESHMFEQKVLYHLSERNNLSIGLSYEEIEVLPPLGSPRSLIPVKPSFSGDDFLDLMYTNITIQDDYRVTDSVSAVIGLMYENSNTYADVYIPRGSVLWQISDLTTLKFLTGAGYMVPSLEVINDQIIGDHGNVKGATDLDPEKLTSYEINLLHKISEKLHINASIYLNKVRDVIAPVNNPDPEAYYSMSYNNLGAKESRGCELNIDWSNSENFKFFLSAAYVDGFYEVVDKNGNTSRKNYLPVTAPWHCKSGMNFLLFENRLNFYIHDLYLSKIQGWNKEKMSGYNLVNIFLSTTDVLNKSWKFSTGVNNLFDKKGYDAPTEDDPLWIFDAPIARRTWSVKATRRW